MRADDRNVELHRVNMDEPMRSLDFTLPDDLIGYWWVAHDIEGAPGVLIFDEKGYAVQFLTTKDRSKGQAIMRLWFTLDDLVTLRFRLSPKGTVGRGLWSAPKLALRSLPGTSHFLSGVPNGLNCLVGLRRTIRLRFRKWWSKRRTLDA